MIEGGIIDILVDYWRRKTKVIDDIITYKVIHAAVVILAAVLTTFCNIIFLKNKEFIPILVLNAFLTIYNKPTIIAGILSRKNSFLLINFSSRRRFIIYQILKENPLIAVVVPSGIVTLIISPAALGEINAAAVVMAVFFIIAGYYLLDIYKGKCKCILIIFMFLNALAVIKEYYIVVPVVVVLNIVFVIKTYKSQLIKSVYHDKYRHAGTSNLNMNAYRVSRMYFMRMPLEKYIEILYEVLVFAIALYYLKIDIAGYLVIAIFMVETELLQEEKMKNFDLFYGKRNFISMTKISGLKRFICSMEFNYAVKYYFLVFWIMCVQMLTGGLGINAATAFLNIALLIMGVSVRYYGATDIVLKNRTDIRQGWFRLIMLYIILLAMTPFMFHGSLQKMSGYRDVYGWLFSLVMDALIMFIKIEKITGVTGDERDKSYISKGNESYIG